MSKGLRAILWGAGCLGLGLLHWRFGWGRQAASQPSLSTAFDWQDLAVVIPARNEAHQLPSLLQALRSLPLGALCVADDHSQDQTAAVARAEGAQVFSVPACPAGWSAKNWACWQVAHQLSQPLILFLDADIVPDLQSLQDFMNWFCAQQLDLACPLLYHAPLPFWQQGLGAFHLLYLQATGIQQQPVARRLYANGQCLLFRASAYQRWGHHQVASALAEDLAMARACLQGGGRYQVYTRTPVYTVQMYRTLPDFIQGWRRNLRLGLTQSSLAAIVEVLCLILAVFGGGRLKERQGQLLSALTLISMGGYQRRWGAFRFWGVLTTPLAVLLFMGLSFWGLLGHLLGHPIVWKARAYHAKRKMSGP